MPAIAFQGYSALIPGVSVGRHTFSWSKQHSSFADSQKLETRMLGHEAEKQMLNAYHFSMIPTIICLSY